jgi:hypothetical protein
MFPTRLRRVIVMGLSMRQPSSSLIVRTFVLLAACTTIHAVTLALQEPKVRVIPRAANRSIVEQLLPEDRIVQVEQHLDLIDFDPEPTAREMIDFLIDTAEIVAIVDVRDAVGTLVDDGKWIHTKLTGVPREVLKVSGGSLVSRGKSIEVQLSGGELTIGKVLVRAGESIQFPKNRQYLMFLRLNRDWNGLAANGAPLLIEKRRLVNLSHEKSAFASLSGMTVSDVTKLVRLRPKTL